MHHLRRLSAHAAAWRMGYSNSSFPGHSCWQEVRGPWRGTHRVQHPHAQSQQSQWSRVHPHGMIFNLQNLFELQFRRTTIKAMPGQWLLLGSFSGFRKVSEESWRNKVDTKQDCRIVAVWPIITTATTSTVRKLVRNSGWRCHCCKWNNIGAFFGLGYEENSPFHNKKTHLRYLFFGIGISYLPFLWGDSHDR